jgi:hypothetical protein
MPPAVAMRFALPFATDSAARSSRNTGSAVMCTGRVTPLVTSIDRVVSSRQVTAAARLPIDRKSRRATGR